MKKSKKIIIALLVVSIMFINVVSVYATSTTVKPLSNEKYYSMVVGVEQENYEEFKSGYTQEEFEEVVIKSLEGLKRMHESNYDDNEIIPEDDELILSVEECAELFGISEQLVEEHSGICGNYVYNRLINIFSGNVQVENIDLNNNIDLTAISASAWATFYADATVGNVFLTKDIITGGIRYGHAGVVQSHTGSTKYISESIGLNANDDYEVVRRELNVWREYNTLCVMYPLTLTNAQKSSAGNQTYYYTIEDNYTYEPKSIKTNLRQSSYTKLNCAGLAYRAYYFMAQFDIVPHLSASEYMYASDIHESSNMARKVKDSGGYLQTSNFDSYAWGA